MAYYDSAYDKHRRRYNNRTIKPWRGQVSFNGKHHHLGRFATYEEAKQAEIKERQRYIAEWEEDHGREYPYKYWPKSKPPV